jgi:hypothetical protein
MQRHFKLLMVELTGLTRHSNTVCGMNTIVIQIDNKLRRRPKAPGWTSGINPHDRLPLFY